MTRSHLVIVIGLYVPTVLMVTCIFGHDGVLASSSDLKESFFDNVNSRARRQLVPDSTEEGKCREGRVFRTSIPKGETNVDHLNGFLVDSYDDADIRDKCVQECCKLGPETCQFAWIFTGKCFAVGCTKENVDKCVPSSIPSMKSSTYILVVHSSVTTEDQPGMIMLLATAHNNILDGGGLTFSFIENFLPHIALCVCVSECVSDCV